MNPNPGPGKRFKKGVVTNPKGAGAHNPDVKAIRRLTQADVADIGSLILEGNVEKLKEVQIDPTTTVLRVWICSVAIKAINRGDAQALNALLDRIVGKAKDVLEFTGNVQSDVKVTKEKVKDILDKLESDY